MTGSTLKHGKGFTKPRKPMNPGKGFQSKGWARASACDEVGEGEGSTFGLSKRKQLQRASSQHDEVGEGVVSGFGLSKAAQTRKGAAFQDEVGEGITGIVGRSKRAQKQEMRRDPDRKRSVPTIDDPSRFKWGQEVGDGVVAQPKSVALRNPALLEMARGRQCLLQAPYTMSHDPATTVACHGNSHKFGKAKGRKAQDFYSAWGCFECHSWLDSSGAASDEKERVFHLAMFRQMLAWEQIAASEVEPQRFRRAAEWALDHLQAEEYDPRIALIELDLQIR